ncbi:uncharacterized protein METZ01_LOCUS240619 [marine metagenome]|uniref:Uncharacterized protein n=1 Tax=marine metagenome TaxID=408172 RepID=A0A382HL20_9ZZZZ
MVDKTAIVTGASRGIDTSGSGHSQICPNQFVGFSVPDPVK